MMRRSLTAGELALVHSVFGDAVDGSKVELVRGKFWPFHPPRVAMAPMGDIYFHPDGGGWSEDFSKESLAAQGFFIHEMTHVWQAQKGGRFYLPLLRHPFCRYGFDLKPGKCFENYGLEQQAEIVRYAFLAHSGAEVAVCPPEGLLPFR